jgi:hypothetical protein
MGQIGLWDNINLLENIGAGAVDNNGYFHLFVFLDQRPARNRIFSHSALEVLGRARLFSTSAHSLLNRNDNLMVPKRRRSFKNGAL